MKKQFNECSDIDKEDVGSDIRKFTRVCSSKFTCVGNVNYRYYISPLNKSDDVPCGEFGVLQFQNGPVGECGINGCHHEDLIAILIHRLESFQDSKFKCHENSMAIDHLKRSLGWLQTRTKDRQDRGVEGTKKV